ncbi:MOSC domain-containing protein [Campylobacter gastrosuis]|uniref:MOSC domain-containing protein n=1 Tax=Campylobacter gastrosuis TaxID=2974576 RepID=A0ABT7HQW3_9BACT|nr:MOSC domain-containing protein [Campylobacter gastrosuis]MDL0089316.1 MOSC domain-containing protein [Campylobacter gastrosuis]
MAILKAVLIGEVKEYGDKNATEPLKKAWRTAMFKVALNGEVFADELGFRGDSVADTKHHGGKEKAIFANSYENYPAWEQFLGLKNLPFGAMGENLTISGLDESSVCIGDIHEIGSLVLQVSQPRKPCFNLSKRWGNAKMATEIFSTGKSGWYYRVLQNGSCKAGDEVRVAKKDSVNLSVLELNRLFYAPNENLKTLEKLKMAQNLAGNWLNDIQKRIENSYDNSYMTNM